MQASPAWPLDAIRAQLHDRSTSSSRSHVPRERVVVSSRSPRWRTGQRRTVHRVLARRPPDLWSPISTAGARVVRPGLLPFIDSPHVPIVATATLAARCSAKIRATARLLNRARPITVPAERDIPSRSHGTPLARHRIYVAGVDVRAQPDDDELAAWCDAVARAVRSGESLSLAHRGRRQRLRGDRTGTRPVRLALDRGVPVDRASPRLAGPIRVGGSRRARPPRRRSRRRPYCRTRGRTLGGPAAEPLDRVAAVLRERCRRRRQSPRTTLRAQARLSTIVLTVLPPDVPRRCSSSPSQGGAHHPRHGARESLVRCAQGGVLC